MVLAILDPMLARLPRLPYALDPLIAEAKRRARQRRLLIWLSLALLIALGVGLTVALPPSGGGSNGVSPAAAGSLREGSPFVSVPKIERARPLRSMSGSHPLRRGTRVGNDFSGTRTFATRRDGFALGNLTASEGGPMYPLATTDGGKTWRIAGLIVNVAAAQGGVDVREAGVVDARTWFMCCGLNTVVDVTTDAGKHWWAAFLPGEVVNVFAYDNPHARLVALVRPFRTAHSRQRLWIYSSVDGRRWTYEPSLKLIY